MRKIVLALLGVLLITTSAVAQGLKSIMKSWIKRSIYDLSRNQKIDDTLYTRYTFSKDEVYICFYPGWNENKQSWNLSGNQLTIGFSTYTIENLTDSTLIISIPGFRRIFLDDETYLNRKAEPPSITNQIDGQPVYEATRTITPRYENYEFRKTIEQNLDGYNIRKAVTFVASFIVKLNGTVDSVQVIKGITPGFDQEVCRQLKKTSKRWKPAIYNGQPVNARMFYTIKYLDSIVR